MATYSPKNFSRPEVLKRVHHASLIQLLEPHRTHLEKQGVSLPKSSENGAMEESAYRDLSKFLMKTDDGPPPALRDALYLIDEMASEEVMDSLLTEVERQNLRLDGGPDWSPTDVALQVYLKAPRVLVRLHAEIRLITRPRSFATYRPKTPPTGQFRIPSDTVLEGLQSDLAAAFDQMGRSHSCQVMAFPRTDEVWFLVSHGDPYRREGTRDAQGTGQVYFRPDRSDVLIYIRKSGEMRLNAKTLKIRRLYREQFGRHIFGDPEHFERGDVYTLEPLKQDQEAALVCTDVEGMEWAKLTSLTFEPGGEPGLTVTWKSEQLFFALGNRGWKIPDRSRLTSATMQIKFTDAKRPRSVTITIPANASYMRDDDAESVEEWLRSRGFIISARRKSLATS